MTARFAALATLAAALFLAAAARAQPLPPQDPFLRIDGAFHTQVVNRLAQDGAGRIIATVSDDKTIRVWQSADLAPLAILRVPVADGDEGALYAVAISPDGRTLLAAGHTGLAWDHAFAVYFFDLQSQKIRARLGGLPATVNHLAFSPDGTRFAMALGDRQGIRLYETATGKLLAQDADGYTDRATWIAFDRSGRFAATGFDGAVRLYTADGKRTAKTVPVPGARPYALAFAPAGDALAVGYADRPIVALLSGRDLTARGILAGAAGEAGGLGAVAWSANGRIAAAGSLRNAVGLVVVRSWTNGGKGRHADTPAAGDTVFDIEAAADGGLLLAGADPALVRLGADGATIARRAGPGIDFRDIAAQDFAVSDDGLAVTFRTPAMRAPWRVDMAERSITQTAGTRGLVPVAAQPVAVTNWRNSAKPNINGHSLALEPEELSRAYAVAPGQDRVLLGTDYQLRVFAPDGRALDGVALPGPAWAVGVSGDGRSVVAAVGDGTLRWFGLGTDGRLEPRIALFAAADGQRWVAWTPEGLFDHADLGGKELVGFLLNRGRAQSPDWFSFAQVYRLFYAPDAVSARLRGAPLPPDTDVPALAAALRALRGQDAPPEVQLLQLCWQGGACETLAPTAVARGLRKPGEGKAEVTLPDGVTQAQLRFRLQGGTGPVDLFLNGRNAGRAAAQGPDGTIIQDIALDPGANLIQLRAYAHDEGSYAQSRPLQVQVPAVVVPLGLETRQSGGPSQAPADAPAPDAGPKPRLYILSVGIDHYKPAINTLGYAVADARAVTNDIRDHAPSRYASVELVELYDADATVDRVLAAMKTLAAKAQNQDTVLIYLSGHGVTIDKRYYFVTQNVERFETIPREALSETRLVRALGEIRARNGLVFLDTCHAGAFSLDSASQIAHESGRYVLAASASLEEALDSYDNRNGVFATAVLRGLNGGAAPGSATVSNFDLGLYVTPLVKQLAGERNHHQSARFKIAAEDAEAFPIVQKQQR